MRLRYKERQEERKIREGYAQLGRLIHEERYNEAAEYIADNPHLVQEGSDSEGLLARVYMGSKKAEKKIDEIADKLDLSDEIREAIFQPRINL